MLGPKVVDQKQFSVLVYWIQVQACVFVIVNVASQETDCSLEGNLVVSYLPVGED